MTLFSSPYYKFSLSPKRVVDERRIQGVQDSRVQGKCLKTIKSSRFGKSPVSHSGLDPESSFLTWIPAGVYPALDAGRE